MSKEKTLNKLQKQVGVLWVNEYQKDGENKKMLSGNINLGILGNVDVAVFPNDSKKEAKHPDYRIVYSSAKSNGGAESSKKPNKQVGVLWIHEYGKDDDKKKMLSGNIDLGALGEVDIAIFPNESKKEVNHPDYRIVPGNGKSNGKSENDKKGKPEMF